MTPDSNPQPGITPGGITPVSASPSIPPILHDGPHEDCAEYRRRLWQRPFSRREMLAGTLGVAALGAVGSHLLLDNHVLERLGIMHPGSMPKDNILIVIQQGGGND